MMNDRISLLKMFAVLATGCFIAYFTGWWSLVWFAVGYVTGMRQAAGLWVPLYHKQMFRAWRAEDALKGRDI